MTDQEHRELVAMAVKWSGVEGSLTRTVEKLRKVGMDHEADRLACSIRATRACRDELELWLTGKLLNREGK